ncbi:hypothetical protein LTI14_02305 [Nesterenkonia sp. YGD6]|uniref:hypothetical protein n=1 Tax=Nesterenkonia sp. YGD6 TaxID=2901231 RepID=UPI001F4C8EED|nr:hypothetical protein [Nesterenkonia sp. YGD6]MCH8562053.1 hypothetical protein [Nesterenkonia sp. YGD6]
MATGRIPRSTREDVAKRILERAVELGWEDMTHGERSATYEQWVVDPQIGGMIGAYLPAERVRVWIKDGPMKEYRRARRGLGPYAKFVPTAVAMEGMISTIVLGSEWAVLPQTIGVKPSRFTAIGPEEDEVTIYWGNPSDLKHIVWGGLIAPRHVTIRMVVVSTPTQPLTSDTKALIHSLQSKLGTDIRMIDR